MIRNYAFKVQALSSHGNFLLKIKPYIRTNGHRIRSMDPIYFSELNIPIREGTPQCYVEAGWKPDYFLDFEDSFTNNGSYNCFNRANQLRILRILEGKVDEDIQDFLGGNGDLFRKGKIVKFEADDGHSLCSSETRYGKTKRVTGLSAVQSKKLAL